MPKKSDFTISAIQNFVQNRKKYTRIPFMLLVDCFHREFKVSTQIMVHDYCIAKCKKSSTCGGLLMALWTIFFTIQNIYVNSNPVAPVLRS